MRSLPDRDVVAGAILLTIGLSLLASHLVPGAERFMPLVIGLALLGWFFLTRAPGALVSGSVVTGIGVGILVAMQGDEQFGGAGFLISLGGGFLLISLLGALLQVPDVRLLPLVPGSLLIAAGTIIWAMGLGQPIAQVSRVWWPLIPIVVGGWLVVMARLRPRGPTGRQASEQPVTTDQSMVPDQRRRWQPEQPTVAARDESQPERIDDERELAADRDWAATDETEPVRRFEDRF